MQHAITPQLVSKHPAMGTTIFSVMSALAAESGAVNLGQGFPDFECDAQLIADVSSAMHEGLNQYPPMPGVVPLSKLCLKKFKTYMGVITTPKLN
jgi:methionine aminotransferase